MRRFLFAVLACVFALPQAYAWDDALIAAIRAMAAGESKASEDQKRLLIRDNVTVNQMRIKGVISDREYQAAQSFYASKMLEWGIAATRENGAELVVQTRGDSRFDAGTDSDYITNARDERQVRAIQQSLNQKISEYVGHLGNTISGGKPVNYLKRNDVDIMADPAGVSSAEEFRRIAAANNDAYSRPLAASYEAKKRAGSRVTYEEIIAYHDEMRDFIRKKQHKSKKLADDLLAAKEVSGSDLPGTSAYARRMALESQLQQVHAQQAKYLDRIQNATEELSRLSGTTVPEASALASRAKTRAPSENVSVRQREIASATAASLSEGYVVQGKMNEYLVLDEMYRRESRRGNVSEANTVLARMEALRKEFSPAQHGELQERLASRSMSVAVLSANMARVDPVFSAMHETHLVARIDSLSAEQAAALATRLRNNTAISDDTKRLVENRSNFAPKRPAAAIVGEMPHMASIAGGLMSVMGIKDRVEQTLAGNHPLVNVAAEDGLFAKAAKLSTVTALELSSIGIIDAVERGLAVDETVKREIETAIKTGRHVNPVAVTARVFAEVGVKSIASVTIAPLLDAAKSTTVAAAEAGALVRDATRNLREDVQREESRQLQNKKFDEAVARAASVQVGPIRLERKSPDGETSLDRVGYGDTIIAKISRDPSWKDDFFVRWELVRANGEVLRRSEDAPITDPRATGANFATNLKQGGYEVVFRLLESKGGKQIDSSRAAFTMDYSLAFGKLKATVDTQPFEGRVQMGQLLQVVLPSAGLQENRHRIEWSIDGERPVKEGDSATQGIDRFSLRLSDTYDIGPHTLAVRAIDKATGKIAAHQQLTFHLEKKPSSLDRLTLQIRQSNGMFAVKDTKRLVRGRTYRACLDWGKTGGNSIESAVDAMFDNVERQKPTLTAEIDEGAVSAEPAEDSNCIPFRIVAPAENEYSGEIKVRVDLDGESRVVSASVASPSSLLTARIVGPTYLTNDRTERFAVQVPEGFEPIEAKASCGDEYCRATFDVKTLTGTLSISKRLPYGQFPGALLIVGLKGADGRIARAKHTFTFDGGVKPPGAPDTTASDVRAILAAIAGASNQAAQTMAAERQARRDQAAAERRERRREDRELMDSFRSSGKLGVEVQASPKPAPARTQQRQEQMPPASSTPQGVSWYTVTFTADGLNLKRTCEETVAVSQPVPTGDKCNLNFPRGEKVCVRGVSGHYSERGVIRTAYKQLIVSGRGSCTKRRSLLDDKGVNDPPETTGGYSHRGSMGFVGNIDKD